MSNKRDEFIKNLSEGVKLTEEQSKAFYERNSEGKLSPQMDELILGYKNYICDLGGGFLNIAELYNDCLKIAEDNEILSDVKLKARIKDFSSSNSNSNKKMLDDVFGMELVTATEFEKEILMLFNHLIFDIQNDKKYNKETGYIAYHCTGDINQKKHDDLKNEIMRIITEAKTFEYKRTRHNDMKPSEPKPIIHVFQVLPNELSKPKTLNEISKVLGKMIDVINQNTKPKEEIPIIEFHFLTTEVEHEAIRGRASHANYKSVNTGLIKEYFEKGYLIRGINTPYKLERKGNELKLQNFDETIIENWPFMKADIVRSRNNGVNSENQEKTATADVLTAYQYPFLRKYLDDEIIYQEELKDKMWEMLKTYMKLYNIDMNQKTKLDEIFK